MRIVTTFVVLLGLAGCATTQYIDDEPLEASGFATELDSQTPDPLVVDRVIMDAVLSDGPGRFLQRMPVRPEHSAQGFVGYRVLALYGQDPDAQPHPKGVFVGDIVTAVNGISIRRPSDLMKVWNHMPNAKQVVVDVQRHKKPLRITIPIIN